MWAESFSPSYFQEWGLGTKSASDLLARPMQGLPNLQNQELWEEGVKRGGKLLPKMKRRLSPGAGAAEDGARVLEGLCRLPMNLLQLHTDKGQGRSLWNGDSKTTFPVGLSVGIKCDHVGAVVSRVPAAERTLNTY